MNPALDGHEAYALAQKLIQELGFDVRDVRNVEIDARGITVTTYLKWEGRAQVSSSNSGMKLETHVFLRDREY